MRHRLFEARFIASRRYSQQNLVHHALRNGILLTKSLEVRQPRFVSGNRTHPWPFYCHSSASEAQLSDHLAPVMRIRRHLFPDDPLHRKLIDLAAGADAPGRLLTFDVIEEGSFPFNLKDRETGTVWSLTGIALTGELEGARLQPIATYSAFWFAWAAFN